MTRPKRKAKAKRPAKWMGAAAPACTKGTLRAKTHTKPGHDISQAAEAKLAAKARKTGDTKTLREIELAQEFARTRTAQKPRKASGRFRRERDKHGAGPTSKA